MDGDGLLVCCSSPAGRVLLVAFFPFFLLYARSDASLTNPPLLSAAIASFFRDGPRFEIFLSSPYAG